MVKLPQRLKLFFSRHSKDLTLIALIPALIFFSTTLKPSLVQAAFISWPTFLILPPPPVSTPPPMPTMPPMPTFNTKLPQTSTNPSPSPTLRPTISPHPTTSPSAKPSINPTIKPTATPTIIPTNSQDYIMTEINKYRASQGLTAVKTDPYTCSFAKTRAGEITSGFNHDGFTNRLNSKTLPYPSYHFVTENIAMTSSYEQSSTSYKDVVNMWINSPGHAANMRADTPFVCVEQNGNFFAYEGWRP